MRKLEAKFQTAFNQYLRKTKIIGHFELKQAKRDSLAYKRIPPHQIEGLLAGGQSEFIWKYSDQDQREKPFDCSCMPPLPGFLVVKFKGIFYIIPIENIVREMHMGKKSLKKRDAFSLCIRAVEC